MIARILIGLIIITVGFSMVYKTPWYLSILGRNYWAETKIGPGGTRLFYKMIGTAITILGIFVVTNTWEQFVKWIFGPIL